MVPIPSVSYLGETLGMAESGAKVVGLLLGLASLSAVLAGSVGGPLIAAGEVAAGIAVAALFGALAVVLGVLAVAAHRERWPFRRPPPAKARYVDLNAALNAAPPDLREQSRNRPPYQ